MSRGNITFSEMAARREIGGRDTHGVTKAASYQIHADMILAGEVSPPDPGTVDVSGLDTTFICGLHAPHNSRLKDMLYSFTVNRPEFIELDCVEVVGMIQALEGSHRLAIADILRIPVKIRWYEMSDPIDVENDQYAWADWALREKPTAEDVVCISTNWWKLDFPNPIERANERWRQVFLARD